MTQHSYNHYSIAHSHRKRAAFAFVGFYHLYIQTNQASIIASNRNVNETLSATMQLALSILTNTASDAFLSLICLILGWRGCITLTPLLFQCWINKRRKLCYGYLHYFKTSIQRACWKSTSTFLSVQNVAVTEFRAAKFVSAFINNMNLKNVTLFGLFETLHACLLCSVIPVFAKIRDFG